VNLADHSKTASAAVEEIPLSLNQEFVCFFDQGDDDGPFGPRYHMVLGWRIRGRIDTDALRRALRDLVVRHEALRTLVVGERGAKHQQIHPPTTPELVIRDFQADQAPREVQADRLIGSVEAETISAGQVPLLRAVLARFDDQDAVLALIVHHLATDGWSMGVIIRDLASCYAAQTGTSGPPLPHAPQYREFSVWQTSGKASAAASSEYWHRQLDGARLTVIPTDLTRSAGLTQSTAAHRYLIPDSVASSVTRLAHKARCSPFMFMLAAYMLVVNRVTGATDVVVPTFTPGRGDGLFSDSVGSFFNLVPLRTSIAGCRTFSEVLDRTRRTCLEGYSHDIPSLSIFAEAPELMQPAMSDDAATVVFQIFPDPVMRGDEVIGGLTYAEITRRLLSQPLSSAIPDGALWTLIQDSSGDVIGNTSFKRNLFNEATIAALGEEFQQILRNAVASPDWSPGLT
jgi:condensation enzyme